jgi:hypothetical protein
MADPRARALIDKHERMVTDRSQFDVLWQEIAERVLPRKARFNDRNSPNRQKGDRQTSKIMDAQPSLALERFGAAAHSLVVPRNQVWHKLKASIEPLNKSIAVTRYFDELNDILFAARYAGNFDMQVQETLIDLGAFGTSALYTGDTGTKLNYRACPLWQMYFAEDQFGVVNLMSYEHVMTARNAVAEFGEEKLPSTLVAKAKSNPGEEYKFLCVVKPRDDLDVTRSDAKGKKFASYEICMENGEIVEDKGYDAFPYAIGRYANTPGEVYGRGPVEMILPDVKMLYAMMNTTVQAAQLAALPPQLAHKDGILDALRLTPGAINYGGVNDQGQQLIHPMQAGGDVRLGLEMMEQKRNVINDALWGKMFQVLLENPQMTATQAMLIAQQQGALLAPTASRIESEFLAKIVERELSILHQNGVLPPPPPELVEAGGGYSVEYDSPLSRARKAEKGVSILRTFEQLAPLAQAAGPGIFARFNFDEAIKVLAEANGAPASCMYTDDEMAAINQAKQQQAQLQQVLAAAPVAADAAKSLAQAGAIAQSAPNQTTVPA